MLALISRIASLLLAIGYVLAAGLSKEGLPFAATVAIGVLIPITLIWFPETIDDLFLRSRYWGTRSVNRSPSAPWLIVAMGWLLLIGVPLYVLFNH
jgi:hypothetical protein